MYQSCTSPQDYVRSQIKKSDVGIEIGAGYNPLLPKKEGYTVYTIDHLSRDQLAEKYKNNPKVDINNIEYVDGVDDGREFRELLNVPDGFDYILSVHNFEHTPNPIRFLQRCETALRENGKIYLIIPDRRGTFDYFRPYSSIGDWMQAYKYNNTVHTFSAFYEHFANEVDGNGDYSTVNFLRTPQEAHKFICETFKENTYLDTHGFIYTPASFGYLISYIYEIGLTHLQIDKIFTTPNSHYQFLAILKVNSQTPKVSLKEYAINMVGENINHRRSFNDPTPNPVPPLRQQVYERFRKSHPRAAKMLYPLARFVWRTYKRLS